MDKARDHRSTRPAASWSGHDGSAAVVAGGALGRRPEPAGWAAGLHVVRTWALSSAPVPRPGALGYVPPLTDFEGAVLEELRADVAALDLRTDAEVTCHVLHGAAGRRLVESSRGRGDAGRRLPRHRRLPRPGASGRRPAR